MNKIVFVILFLTAAAIGNSTVISNCRSNAPLPHYAEVEGCVTAPCMLPQLSKATLRAMFGVSHHTDSLTSYATAFIGLIPINYPLGEQSIVCNNENVNCPVSANSTVDYTFSLYIEPFMPVGISVHVEFRVEDDSSRTLFCMRVPVTIVPPVAAAEEVKVQYQREENRLI